MASLEVLLDSTVSTSSSPNARLTFTLRIDTALKDLEKAQAANRSPVKQALKLFRSRSTPKLDAQLEKNDDDTVIALAQEVSSGRRALLSLQLSQLSLLQRALRTRRNSLAPIFRLPMEVLAPILEQCTTIEDDAPRFQTGKFVSGLHISHVCRRWRAIAIASSRFWTHIVLSRSRWALEMLHRSKAAPLVVGVDVATAATKTVAARDLVLAQLARIRELHVNLPASRNFPAALIAPAPILETLHLWFDVPVRFAPTLFQDQAPALRHLSLRHCMWDWASPLWDNLVSLELVDAAGVIDSAGHFLPLVLARMQHLRALKLIGTLPESPVPDAEPVLLNLETLTIQESSWNCACFLRSVLLPKCHIIVQVEYTNSHERFVWDALEAQRAGAEDPTISGLELADLKPMPDGTSSFGVGLFNRGDVPRYSVRVTAAAPLLRNWREETVYIVMTIMSLEQVSTLTVRSAVLRLPAALLQLTHVRSAVFRPHVEPFTAPLEGDPLMGAGDLTRFDRIASAVYYPRLRKIAFRAVDFTQGKHMEVMLDWLAQRRRLNLGIEEIRFVGCTLTSPDLGSLGELVSHVHNEDGK